MQYPIICLIMPLVTGYLLASATCVVIEDVLPQMLRPILAHECRSHRCPGCPSPSSFIPFKNLGHGLVDVVIVRLIEMSISSNNQGE